MNMTTNLASKALFRTLVGIAFVVGVYELILGLANTIRLFPETFEFLFLWLPLFALILLALYGIGTLVVNSVSSSTYFVNLKYKINYRDCRRKGHPKDRVWFYNSPVVPHHNGYCWHCHQNTYEGQDKFR